MLCPSDCESCEYKYSCDPSKCLPENDCLCASKSIPNGIPLNDTPQFILFTLDDSFNTRLMPTIKNLDFLLQNDQIIDTNGCSLRPSVYYLLDSFEFFL